MKFSCELEVNAGRRYAHVGVAINTQCKITHIKTNPCCFKAQMYVVLWLNLHFLQGHSAPVLKSGMQKPQIFARSGGLTLIHHHHAQV